MTDAQLAELEALEKQATKGEWLAGCAALIIPPMHLILREGGGIQPNDATLIAAMRNALPELLAELRAKQREVDQARTTRRAFQELAKKKHEKDAATIDALRAALRVAAKIVEGFKGSFPSGSEIQRLTETLTHL